MTAFSGHTAPSQVWGPNPQWPQPKEPSWEGVLSLPKLRLVTKTVTLLCPASKRGWGRGGLI